VPLPQKAGSTAPGRRFQEVIFKANQEDLKIPKIFLSRITSARFVRSSNFYLTLFSISYSRKLERLFAIPMENL